MKKGFVFDSVIDPIQEYCLVANQNESFISKRGKVLSPICEHRFYDIEKLETWYNDKWTPDMKTLCPMCQKNKNRNVLIVVPHSNCKDLTAFEKSEHYCDFFAKEVADMFDKEFKKRGYTTILIDAASKRTKYDENRPQLIDSWMRKKIKNALQSEPLAFALEIHSYPPTDEPTKNLDFYVLDNFLDSDNPTTTRVKNFIQLSENDGIKIGLFYGDKKKNYLQNLFREHRLDSFLFEANEKNMNENLDFVQEKVVELTKSVIRSFIQ